MLVHWVKKNRISELWLEGVDMGWVDDDNRVYCMWMSSADDDRVVAGHLLETQYPEDAKFETRDEAKATLLEFATAMYIGGFRGR